MRIRANISALANPGGRGSGCLRYAHGHDNLIGESVGH